MRRTSASDGCGDAAGACCEREREEKRTSKRAETEEKGRGKEQGTREGGIRKEQRRPTTTPLCQTRRARSSSLPAAVLCKWSLPGPTAASGNEAGAKGTASGPRALDCACGLPLRRVERPPTARAQMRPRAVAAVLCAADERRSLALRTGAFPARRAGAVPGTLRRPQALPVTSVMGAMQPRDGCVRCWRGARPMLSARRHVLDPHSSLPCV